MNAPRDGFHRRTLGRHGRRGFGFERGEDLSDRTVIERALDRAAFDRADAGEADAVGRKYAGEGMDIDLAHPQGVGHGAGMLAAGAAEAGQGVVRQVMAAFDGNLAYGAGHVVHRQRGEPQREVLRRGGLSPRRGDLGGEAREFRAHRRGVQRLRAVAEDFGKEVRLDAPQ